jgi:hypothetical protein
MIPELLAGGPVVANVGVRDFALSVAAQGAEVVQVDWSPPPKLEPDLEALLEEIE